MFVPELAVGVALGFLVGIVLHEVAHHRIAVALGDPTPRLMGRNTAAPATHADPLGSYVFPGIFTIAAAFGHLGFGTVPPPFGWGKPHAIGARGFRHGRRDAVVVALAGPAMTAVLAAGFGYAADATSGILETVLSAAALVNASLTMFELLPIPGRDGARILAAFLNPRAAMRIEELAQYHVLFMVGLFLILQGVTEDMLRVSCRLLTPYCG